jgi:CheY-like chemotaxis protein
MSHRILFCHDEPIFAARALNALREAGHETIGVTDPMEALATFDRPHGIELLITSMEFGRGHQSGLSLALMARHNRAAPTIPLQVLFFGRPAMQEHSVGVGEWMSQPIALPDMVAAASRLLA